MSSHPALCLLRADHLHALALARVARHASEHGSPGAAEWAWDEARKELERGELGARLRVVEEVLLPMLEEGGLEDLPGKVREAHRDLFALLRPVAPEALRTHLRALSFHLASCVRVDDGELLRQAERLLSESALAALLDACLATDDAELAAAPQPLRASSERGNLPTGRASGLHIVH